MTRVSGGNVATAAAPAAAIIGAGLMGRWHAAVALREGARIVGVVDADVARAQALAARHGAAAFGSVEAMLSSIRPRVAHVCTPMDTHLACCLALLEAGIDVLCEKPLAATVSEIESLLGVAARRGRIVCPVHQFAMQDGVRIVGDRLGELGPITRVAFTFSSAGGGQRKGSALDEVVADIMPHAFSVLCRLLPTLDLAALRWQAVRAAAGELCAMAATDGLTVSMVFSMSSRPTEAAAMVVGQRGSAHIDFFHGFAYLLGGEVSRTRKLLQPFTLATRQWLAAGSNLARRAWRREAAYPGLRPLVAGFYRAAAAAAPAPLTAAEIVTTYRARDALLRCAAEAA